MVAIEDQLDKELLNLSDKDTKHRLYQHVAALQGLHEVTIKPKRETRRVRANRYYFGLIVQPTRKAINSQGNNFALIEVHEWIKSRVLGKELFNPTTGELIGTVGQSSHDKNIAEFHAFVNRAKELVYEMFGVDAPDSDLYFDGTDAARAA